MPIVGLLESFDLAEEFGDKALTPDELFFMAAARKKRGCRLLASKLTDKETKRVMVLGLKCKLWKEKSR